MKAPRAPLHTLTPSALLALCMLAGGALIWQRKGWLDVDGGMHMHWTVNSLVTHGLVEFYQTRMGHSHARLTDPRGRWFACTALAKSAELLAAHERERTDRRAALLAQLDVQEAL
jgi:hypothetical protein